MLRIEHECEIVPTDEDIHFLPGRGLFQRALDAFRRLMMASEKNPGTRKYLPSRATIIAEKRRHLRNYKYILHPFSILRYVRQISITLKLDRDVYFVYIRVLIVENVCICGSTASYCIFATFVRVKNISSSSYPWHTGTIGI